MDIQKPGFTGFFNDSNKRIDLVMVIPDKSNNDKEKMRVDYFMSALRLGLEIELEQGKLDGHKNIIFVKVHAPDSIIEAYGIYFKEKRFFKDNHIEFVSEPFINILSTSHERQLIKLIRQQYPGPSNYSTLERSLIVYKIFLALPFGPHENQYGLHRLMKQDVILDAYALHDGPYFTAPKQNFFSAVNARQALFYNWVGKINFWKAQPLNTIREYMGERVAFYFAYYQHFNMMLLVPAIIGSLVAVDNYFREPVLDSLTVTTCSDRFNKSLEEEMSQFKIKAWMICPECQNFTWCPLLLLIEYCDELTFIAKIDTWNMFYFAWFISFWGVVFVFCWNNKEKYLTWLWEVNKKKIDKIIRPDYEILGTVFKKSARTGILESRESNKTIIRRITVMLLASFLIVAGMFGIFLFSAYICHFKHILLYINGKPFSLLNRFDKRPFVRHWKIREHEYIAYGAIIYTVCIYIIKLLTPAVASILTEYENHKTFKSYDWSFALKLYSIFFSCSFTLLISYVFICEFLFFSHTIDYYKRWNSIGNYLALNNGLGTALDDIYVTFGVMVFLEQVICKIPTLFWYIKTDYNEISLRNVDAPCWEREYKLKALDEDFFHIKYNYLVIQFALATLFSPVFPLAATLIFFINVWDIRNSARRLLLGYRRPLLLNAPGPGLWHYITYLTAFLIPIFNTTVIALQSKLFEENFSNNMPFVRNYSKPYSDNEPFLVDLRVYEKIKTEDSPYLQSEKHCELHYSHGDFYCLYGCTAADKFFREIENQKYKPVPILEYYHNRSYRFEIICVNAAIALFVYLVLHFWIDSYPSRYKELMDKEKIIMRKYVTRKDL